MKLLAVLFLLLPSALHAQVPAGSTGICKDGTYTSAASKDGACTGHKGVKTWFPAGMPQTAPAMPIPTRVKSLPSVPAPEQAALPPPAISPASAGSPNLVWVNTPSHVYHCYGTQFYGKTKVGSFMSESEAKAQGAHPNHGKTCAAPVPK